MENGLKNREKGLSEWIFAVVSRYEPVLPTIQLFLV